MNTMANGIGGGARTTGITILPWKWRSCEHLICSGALQNESFIHLPFAHRQLVWHALDIDCCMRYSYLDRIAIWFKCNVTSVYSIFIFYIHILTRMLLSPVGLHRIIQTSCLSFWMGAGLASESQIPCEALVAGCCWYSSFSLIAENLNFTNFARVNSIRFQDAFTSIMRAITVTYV